MGFWYCLCQKEYFQPNKTCTKLILLLLLTGVWIKQPGLHPAISQVLQEKITGNLLHVEDSVAHRAAGDPSETVAKEETYDGRES